MKQEAERRSAQVSFGMMVARIYASNSGLAGRRLGPPSSCGAGCGCGGRPWVVVGL